MSEKIVQLNEEVIKGQIKELVRGSVGVTMISNRSGGNRGKRRRVSHRSHSTAAAAKKDSERKTIVLM